MNVLVLKLTKDLQDTSSDLETIDKERKKKQVNVLKYELQEMTQKYNNLKLKLDESTQKLSRYLPRNVGKRERCKDRRIEVLESESLELVAENYLLTEREEELEENLSKANASYEKEHNRVYFTKTKI